MTERSCGSYFAEQNSFHKSIIANVINKDYIIQ